MTTLRKETRSCAVCGLNEAHEALVSSSQLGVPDLDLRPPPPLRGALSSFVQSCSRCGYAAPAIDQLLKDAGRWVRTPEYRAVLSDEAYPPVARRFLAAAFLEERAKEAGNAALSCLRAAWICDDLGAIDAARTARKRAVLLFRAARASGLAVLGPSEELAVIADLLRRAGDFEASAQASREGMILTQDERLVSILEFQRHKAQAQDTGVYRLDQVEAEDTTNPTIDDALATLGDPIGVAVPIDDQRVAIRLNVEARVRRATDLVLGGPGGENVRVRVESVTSPDRVIAGIISGAISGAGPWMVFRGR